MSRMSRIFLITCLISGARSFSTMRKNSRNLLDCWSALKRDSPGTKLSQSRKSMPKSSNSSLLSSELFSWTLRICGWSRMTVSRNQFLKSTNSTSSKSTKRSLRRWRRLRTVWESCKRRHSSCTRRGITSSWRKWFRTLRTFCCCSTLTQNTTCADTGRSWSKSHSTRWSSITRQSKGSKCTTIQTQTTCSE